VIIPSECKAIERKYLKRALHFVSWFSGSLVRRGWGVWADEQLHFEMRTHFICFAAGILGSPPLSPHCKHNSKWQLKVGKVKNRTPEVRWLHVILVEGWRGGIISIPLSLSDSLGNHRWITQNWIYYCVRWLRLCFYCNCFARLQNIGSNWIYRGRGKGVE